MQVFFFWQTLYRFTRMAKPIRITSVRISGVLLCVCVCVYANTLLFCIILSPPCSGPTWAIIYSSRDFYMACIYQNTFWLETAPHVTIHAQDIVVLDSDCPANTDLINGKVHTRTATKALGGGGGRWGMYSSTLSLNSALDEGGWSTPRPSRFAPGNYPVPIVQ
jgi:hypothetical protein